jgi:two-component system CitB family sensor kinase
VDNAIDAAAGTPEAWVEVELALAHARMRIVVADSGQGVPPSARASVFDLGWSTKHSPSGASRGMGLALVRQVVQRRGGTVVVEGDRGAVFRVSLPLSVVDNVGEEAPLP